MSQDDDRYQKALHVLHNLRRYSGEAPYLRCVLKGGSYQLFSVNATKCSSFMVCHLEFFFWGGGGGMRLEVYFNSLKVELPNASQK